MARMEIWRGEAAMGSLIEAAIRRRDEKGDVAKNLQSAPAQDGEVFLAATFVTKGDGQDAAAFADGFAEGYVTATEDADSYDEDEEEDPGPSDEEPGSDDDENDEDEDEDEDDEDEDNEND